MCRLRSKRALISIPASTIVIQGILDGCRLVTSPVALGTIGLNIPISFVCEEITLYQLAGWFIKKRRVHVDHYQEGRVSSSIPSMILLVHPEGCGVARYRTGAHSRSLELRLRIFDWLCRLNGVGIVGRIVVNSGRAYWQNARD